MPIYEFICSNCGNPFEELVFSISKFDGVVCPSCGSEQVKKKMSTFSSKIAGSGSSLSLSSAPASSCSTGSA